MPKGIFPRPAPRGRTRLVAGERQVSVPSALEAACTNFEAEVGGRLALVEHLVHAPLTADQDLLVGAIADPRNDSQSLARICYTFGIDFSNLLQLFRSAGFVKAQIAALQRVWGLLPEVAGDVMARSVPHALPCITCAGTGTQTKTTTEGTVDGVPKITRYEEACEVCRGAGEVLVQPKLDTQKLALELGGLVARPGMQVNLTQQQAVVQSPGSGDFWAAADRVVYPTAPAAPAAGPGGAPVGSAPVDAEFVEDPE